MLTDQEKIEAISRIIKRQFNETETMMKDALDDSNIQTEDYGEVKGIVRQMMSIAVQQAEERQMLYREITKKDPEPCTLPVSTSS